MVSVAVIAGDGIGQEVTPVGISCVDAALAAQDQRIDWVHYPWGSDLYRQTGRMMPANGIDLLSQHDAVFLGAVGMPDIPDTETLWGLLIPIRREFDQYVNLRPVKALRGVPSPVRGGDDIDVVIVRENTEGEYSEIGGRAFRHRDRESAIQVDVFTRFGIERVARYAANLAASRRGVLTSATKSNGIIHTMPFWDEVVAEVVASQEGLLLESVLIDALGGQTGAAACGTRRHRGVKPVRRHPLGPRRSGRRVDRCSAEREPEPRTSIPLAIRTSARLRPRHRRPRHRQSHRANLDRSHDA